MSSNIKTEVDHYDGPPPPDEIPSNKPQLPSNRITPLKATTTESIVNGCEKSFVVSKLTSKKN